MRIKTEIPLTLSLISKLFDNALLPDTQISAISTDSRICEENDLFIALRGENFDGTDFIEEAKSKKAFVISERFGDITVENSRTSLLKIASYYKSLVSPQYTVAVTGSCGKTTVKDFIDIILKKSMNTHKTVGNYNNAIGLSHTLLTMPSSTEALICELGMNHKGEINELSNALKPSISVITNIGTAHIGNLGSREAIAEAKLEIENGMIEGKTVVFKDEPLLSKTKNPYFISFSDKDSDMYIKILSRTEKGCEFSVKTARYEYSFASGLSALHNLSSLCLSIATATLVGLAPEDIYEGVSSITEADLRQSFLTVNGYKLYDDSYNSSPDAVISGLRMLAEREERVSAIIGDMLELGDKTEDLHEYIGKECAKLKVNKLYAFGKYAKHIVAGAILGGMNEENIFINNDLSRPDITASQVKESYCGERILVKGSHGVKIDRVITILKEGDI